MIKRFFYKIKMNRLHSLAINEDNHRQRLMKVEEKHKVIRTNMTNSPCAINDMSYCNSLCVHFDGGHIQTIYWQAAPYVDDRSSKCKLWK